jgi:hypothetical protein
MVKSSLNSSICSAKWPPPTQPEGRQQALFTFVCLDADLVARSLEGVAKDVLAARLRLRLLAAA